VSDRPVDREEFEDLRRELREELEALRKQLGDTLEELTHLKDHFLRVFPPDKTKD
jgi:ABC-type Fe3+/spermidine/putrescine transport system ATPase subunit